MHVSEKTINVISFRLNRTVLLNLLSQNQTKNKKEYSFFLSFFIYSYQCSLWSTLSWYLLPSSSQLRNTSVLHMLEPGITNKFIPSIHTSSSQTTWKNDHKKEGAGFLLTREFQLYIYIYSYRSIIDKIEDSSVIGIKFEIGIFVLPAMPASVS